MPGFNSPSAAGAFASAQIALGVRKVSFNVHDPEFDLLADHFIEASAGTGKTYTIEHLVTRLVREKGYKLEEILLVTFTKAATFELKERILAQGVGEGRSSIFTIHGFCLQTLQSYAFESSFPLGDVEVHTSHNVLREVTREVLRYELASLHPRQLEVLLSMHRHDEEGLSAHLTEIAAQHIPIETGPCFLTQDREMQSLFATYDPERLLADLHALAPLYGKTCDRQKQQKPEILKAFADFVKGDWVQPLLLLLQEENRLKRGEVPSLHYPEALSLFLPKIAAALDPWHIFATVAEKVRVAINARKEREGWVFFEDLIARMKELVTDPHSAAQIRAPYRAVFIDEFQDTDPDQWAIFSTLFLGHVPLYVVGDPKQAIYRFRRADIYTYLTAKEQMGHASSLDTNFRSSPPLVDALNTLFAPRSFPLPRLHTALPYFPVKAGREDPELLLPPLVFLEAKDEPSLFIEVIDQLQKHPTCSAAVLVKDRYQAQRFVEVCPLPVRLRRARSLLESEAVPRMREWLQALCDPQEEALRPLLQGRFSICHSEQILAWSHSLPQQGVLRTMQQILRFITATVSIQPGGPQLLLDLKHLAELLEMRGGTDPRATLECLCQEDPEQEAFRGRQILEGRAIEVMTIHASKGLEFDLVFPIAFALPPTEKRDLVYCPATHTLTPSPAAWESHRDELAAERERQFYVACTRAKKRLYLPGLYSRLNLH